jgi:two-component system sensor histidine kinase DesK
MADTRRPGARQEPCPGWRQEIEDADTTPIGRLPENRRQAAVKLLWVGVWLLYLGSPVGDLADGGRAALVTAAAGLGLAAFVASYLLVVFYRANTPGPPQRWVYGVLAAQTALSVALSATMGRNWLVLFVYVSVACGAALPTRQARRALLPILALLAGVGVAVDPHAHVFPMLLIPALLGTAAMIAVRQLVQTMRELREARRTVAQLAATEERLRLARDLHDLLGHSLSLITLKSELAGRMLPDRPGDAAREVSDIERVSRQALVDVREAVSGYRRPTLAAELANARTALASAGISTRLHVPERVPELRPEAEGALAWALREAVTNVVRHSGARTCVAALSTGAGEAALTVSDDGRGPGAGQHLGNGLTGLSERLLLAGGSLRTGRAGDGGFALTAVVPLDPEPVPAEPGGSAGTGGAG